MRLTRRSVLIGAGSAFLAGALPASAAGVRVIAGPAFGASWRVTLHEEAEENPIAAAIRSIVDSVDAAMSPFRADSEVSRFNASGSCDWQALSPETCAVVRQSLAVAARSRGAFDPTVGPIVGRYGFGPIREVSTGSFLDIAVREDAVKKSEPGLTLDLCGIAKGHALDRMVAALDGFRVTDFVIELGGEVFARGAHPDGRAWQVGIERPVPGPTTLQRIVQLDGRALATSGDAVNGYTISGRRYSHIIDPRRGEPADNGIASVSVFMPAAAIADALATALMAMGPEAGAALAEYEEIPALFVVREGGALREIMTGGFADAVIA
ncbi:MAG: FAD:protein FMN transferase [Alphaproteobacteria bacterium]|nr:FAD:protein FMN transferase [Alphaproteobacteria bacterium]